MSSDHTPRHRWLVWLRKLLWFLLAIVILILALAACKKQPTIWNPYDLDSNNNGHVPEILDERR